MSTLALLNIGWQLISNKTFRVVVNMVEIIGVIELMDTRGWKIWGKDKEFEEENTWINGEASSYETCRLCEEDRTRNIRDY